MALVNVTENQVMLHLLLTSMVYYCQYYEGLAEDQGNGEHINVMVGSETHN